MLTNVFYWIISLFSTHDIASQSYCGPFVSIMFLTHTHNPFYREAQRFLNIILTKIGVYSRKEETFFNNLFYMVRQGETDLNKQL